MEDCLRLYHGRNQCGLRRQATGVINDATAGFQYFGIVFRWSDIRDYWVIWIHKNGSNNVELIKTCPHTPTSWQPALSLSRQGLTS